MSKYIDLTGRVFKNLTVVRLHEKKTDAGGKVRTYWMCRCECGREKVITRDALLRQSKCGNCYGTHKRSGTREYKIWVGMIQRCTNPKFPKYDYYGGRGISVCDRWKKSFPDFLADVGLSPTTKHSLGRIDNNGNYEPSNIEWQDRSTQMLNTRRSRFVTYRGITLNITEWCKKLSLNFATVHNRIRRGMTVDEALSKPVQKKKVWKRTT